MTTEIKIRKGTEAQLPTLGLAEPGFTTDTKCLYIGDGVGNILIGPSGNNTTLSGLPLAAVQARGTSNITLTTTFQYISFDTLDVSTDTSVLELDNLVDSRINIKETGVYLINYSSSVRSSGNSRDVISKVVANGTNDLNGSYVLQNLYQDETHSQASMFIVSLTTGDFIELAISCGSTPVDCLSDQFLSIVKLTGAQGPPGADGTNGSGSTLIIKEEGTNLVNTPHSAINFIGENVTAQDVGGGVVDITINIPTSLSFGTWYAWGGDASLSSTNSTSYIEKASLSVVGIPTGYYRLGWYFEWRRKDTRSDFEARVTIDDTDTVMEINQESKDNNSYHAINGFVITQLLAGDHFFDIDYGGETNKTSYIRRARLEIWRVA